MARPNIPLLQIPARNNFNEFNIQRMNSPRRRFNNFNNNGAIGPLRLNFNQNVNANIYANRPHNGERNVAENAENAIMLNAIENGDEMVNFHGEFNRGHLYKKSTFNSLPKNRNGTKKNPMSRATIRANNVRYYRARKVGGAKKRKTMKNRRSK